MTVDCLTLSSANTKNTRWILVLHLVIVRSQASFSNPRLKFGSCFMLLSYSFVGGSFTMKHSGAGVLLRGINRVPIEISSCHIFPWTIKPVLASLEVDFESIQISQIYFRTLPALNYFFSHHNELSPTHLGFTLRLPPHIGFRIPQTADRTHWPRVQVDRQRKRWRYTFRWP